MVKSVLKFFAGLLIGLVIALVVAFNVLLVWVATGPRSLDTVSSYIEQALQPGDKSYSVSIGHTLLLWDGWQHPIDLRLRDVAIITRDSALFSRFPEISLGVDVLSLPLGRILPTSLTVTHPVISLYQNDDRSISLGFRKDADAPVAPPTQAVPLAAVFAPLVAPESTGPLRKLRFITILGADISVGGRGGMFFKAGNTNLLFRRDRSNAIRMTGGTHVSYGNYESSLDGEMTLQPDESVFTGRLNFSQMMPGALAALFFTDNRLNGVNVPLGGKADVAIDMNGLLRHVHFSVDGGKGDISSDKLEGKLPVNALHAEGDMGQNFSQIILHSITGNFNGMELAGHGSAVFDPQGGGLQNAALHLDATLKHIPTSNVHMLWPPSISPQSRAWVTENVTDGMVPLAEAHIAIAPGDLAKPVLPRTDVNASITLEGTKIRYLPDHPPLTAVHGVVHVDGVSLNSDIAAGDYMTGTKVTSGKLDIDDLNADNPYIKVGFNASSPARDVVHFLGLPRINHAKRLNLDENTAQGTVTGNAAVGFHFFAPRDANGKENDDDITYDAKGEAKDIAAPGFMKKFDISNASGSFSVNNTSLEFKGKGAVNGTDASAATVRYLFKPEGGFDTFIDATAIAPAEALPRFGYPAFPFLKGKLGVDASMKQGAALETYKATIDLTNATVDYKTLLWNKPDKEAATLTLTAQKKGDVVTIPAFTLQGHNIQAKGSAALDSGLNGFSHLAIAPLRHGNTDLDSLTYDDIPGGVHIAVSGASADVSPWVDDDSKDSTFSFEHFPALELKAEVAHLVLGKERILEGVKADAACDTHLCSSASFTGNTIDGKPFAFHILRNPKGVRQMSLHAQSAGAFLKATNIFDGMEGGDLSITGNYDEATGLAGRLDVSEYTVRNAPVLAKMLSLASLTGVFDALQGNGIRFDRLSASYNLNHDVITVAEGKTHGSAIGMTVDGTITFPNKTLDFQGAIIPAYTLNNVLGKVPLVGNLLTGGEGQGVFAARYSIKGEQKNPDVSVNPLSILTPGFLRGVFDILDTPKKPDAAEP